MTEVPPPSTEQNRTPTASPFNRALPPRPVDAAALSVMGEHTPGRNSDAYYVASHRELGRPLGLICDGISGSGFEQRLFSGEWMANQLVGSLSGGLDLTRNPSREKILGLLLPEPSFPFLRTAMFLLNAMPDDAVADCVQRFLNNRKFALGGSFGPLLVDQGAGESLMCRYRQRYIASGRIQSASLDYDAVRSALIEEPELYLGRLTAAPRIRVALSIIDASTPLVEQFKSAYQNSLVGYGGTTIVGAVELQDSLVLFNAGDSRGCIVSPQGLLPLSLTENHQDADGVLSSFLGIQGAGPNARVILPSQLSTRTIDKSTIPPGSFLVMWSDGYYLDFALDKFLEALTLTPLTEASILDAMESYHRNCITLLREEGRKFSVDDRTAIVIKL